MISIVTPTYNRSHTLRRLFDSLNAQDCLGFEWLIVDDGSTDDTQRLCEEFKASAKFELKILVQKNSGKHVAVNLGCDNAVSEWIIIVDSDDALPCDAVSNIVRKIKFNNDIATVGLCFRKAHMDGALVGSSVDLPDGIIMAPSEAGSIFKGDLAYVFRREAHLRFPFPVVFGEKFVPEQFIWNKISDLGNIVFFPTTVVYLCEYLPDGYSANFATNLKLNPRGFFMFYYAQVFREKRVILKVKCVVRCFQCFIYMLIR